MEENTKLKLGDALAQKAEEVKKSVNDTKFTVLKSTIIQSMEAQADKGLRYGNVYIFIENDSDTAEQLRAQLNEWLIDEGIKCTLNVSCQGGDDEYYCDVNFSF